MASRVREQLNDAMNAQHLGFLIGSGCSSLVVDGKELGIPTMDPLAKAFIAATGSAQSVPHLEEVQAKTLKDVFGIDLASTKYENNLERQATPISDLILPAVNPNPMGEFPLLLSSSPP